MEIRASVFRKGTTMSPDAQRIAIAKACGWKSETHGPEWCQYETKMPDYLNNLNAMHTAWTGLTYNQQAEFGHWLSIVVFGKGLADGMLYGEHDLSRLANVTAAQRAEAFLRTFNLWEDAK